MKRGGFTHAPSINHAAAAALLRNAYLSHADSDQADVLVALKVVRQDTDGSLIIAWKLLQKYPAPKLARNNQ